MAQTKSRTGGSKRSTSRSSSTKSRNGSGAQSTRSRSSSRATNRKSSAASKKSSASKSSAASKKPAAKSTTQSNGSKLATFAQKAKAPAAAGGAALIGLAGGLAMGRNHKRKGVLGRVPKPKMPNLTMPKISMPKPDSALKAVGNAAGEVADRSQRLGQVAAEVQKASDAISKRS